MTKELTNAEKREMLEKCKKEFKALQDKYPFVEWYGSLMHANCMLPLDCYTDLPEEQD